jgi:hypothetical protein
MTLLCPNGHDVKLNNEVTGEMYLSESSVYLATVVETTSTPKLPPLPD